MSDNQSSLTMMKVMEDYIAQKAEHKKEAESDFQARKESSASMRSLFKQMATYDSWLVLSEAIPLARGMSPFEAEELGAHLETWHHILRDRVLSAKGIALNIIDADRKEKFWRVRPKEFVEWLYEKNVQCPPELFEVFEVITTSDSKPKKIHGNSESNALKREAVLRAAIGAMIAFPKECKTNDKFSAAAIARSVERHSPALFDKEAFPDGEPPYKTDTMQRHISEAMNVGLIVKYESPLVH